MVRRWTGIALAILLAIALVACSNTSSPTPPRSTAPAAIRLSGSGTAMPLARLVCDAYPGRDVTFTYLPGLHSTDAIEGVARGDFEMGAVSRMLTDDEAALGLRYTHLSDDAVIVAVHPSVTVEALSTDQVRSIYGGDHTNWKEVGGPDLPIVVLDRNEDESAKVAFRTHVLGADLPVAERAVSLFYEPDMVDGVTSTVGAIGYFSLGYAVSQDVPVRVVALDGVVPSVETVTSGEYGVIRPLGIVTRANAGAHIDALLAWATGSDASALIASRGFAPPR